MGRNLGRGGQGKRWPTDARTAETVVVPGQARSEVPEKFPVYSNASESSVVDSAHIVPDNPCGNNDACVSMDPEVLDASQVNLGCSFFVTRHQWVPPRSVHILSPTILV